MKRAAFLVARLTALVIGVLLLPPAGAEAQLGEPQPGASSVLAPPERDYRSVSEVMDGWREYAPALAELPPEERAARGLAFFAHIPWSKVWAWCTEGSVSVDPERDVQALEGIVTSMMQRRAVGPDTMAAMIRDPNIRACCQEPLVKHISRNRHLYAGTPDGEMLARAFVELADTRVRERGIQFGLERGAVCLWASDELMNRMMAHCRSGDPSRMEQGIMMLGQALDERAGDSLLTYLGRLYGSGAHPQLLGKGLGAAAKRLGSGAFDLTAMVFHSSPDSSLRRAAAMALAHTQDPRFHPILLAMYADSATGIVDATHAAAARRHDYWDLWLWTRITEESLMRVLRTGGPEEARLAIELIDRESRYGPPASDSVHTALEEWAEGAPDADRARIAEILRRFRAYPDRRPKMVNPGQF